MSIERLTKQELAERIGESTKQITRYVAGGCPTVTGGKIPWQPFRAWWVERKIRLERERLERERPVDIEEARRRKMEAEAKAAELDVAQKLAQVIPIEEHEASQRDLCGRLMPVLQNAPSNYGMRLERVGVPAHVAESVLEDIATELTKALQGVADEFDAESTDSDSPEAPALA